MFTLSVTGNVEQDRNVLPQFASMVSEGRTDFLVQSVPGLVPLRTYSSLQSPQHSPMYSLGIGDEQKKQPALPRAVEIYDSVSRLSS